MRVIYGIKKIKRFPRAVAAVGVFDGLHRGHSRILRAAVEKARRIKGASIALTFDPHPQREESLYSLKHRLRLIAGLGIDVCVVAGFTRSFSRLSPDDFVKNIILKRIGARHLYVGSNFRFGREAKGDYRTLEKLAKEHRFGLKLFRVIGINRRPVSSTFIRRLIKKGDFPGAQKLLGRPVSILGTVVRGSFLGRRLGFATANINPHHEVIPPSGIYAVRALFQGRTFPGICYIGGKPTFIGRRSKVKGRRLVHIEAHIFNFQRNIYGRDLEIQFIKKIREEKKFASPQELSCQVKMDIRRTKKILSHYRKSHKI